MITVFQCITMEGWTTVMYYVSFFVFKLFESTILNGSKLSGRKMLNEVFTGVFSVQFDC